MIRTIGRPPVSAIAFSPDGKVAAFGGKDVSLFDVATGNLLAQFKESTGDVGLGFTPDGKTLVCASQNGKISVYDLATGKLRHTMDNRLDGGRCMALSADGTTVAFGSAYSTVRLWCVATGKELFTDFAGHDSWVETLVFAPDGKSLLSCERRYGGQIRQWQTGAWKLAKVLPGGRHIFRFSG